MPRVGFDYMPRYEIVIQHNRLPCRRHMPAYYLRRHTDACYMFEREQKPKKTMKER